MKSIESTPIFALSQEEFFQRIEIIISKYIQKADEEELLSVREVAKMFGTSVQSIHNSIQRGTMKPDYRRGSLYFFKKGGLMAYQKANATEV